MTANGLRIHSWALGYGALMWAVGYVTAWGLTR